MLQLNENQLTGGVPASLGKCTKLKTLVLSENQLEGAVPATELAALTALTDLYLHENEGLTITASGAQALKKAVLYAKLPRARPSPNNTTKTNSRLCSIL